MGKSTDISMYPQEVQKEAALLLKHATKEERARLNFFTLNGNDPERCIYGQMTYSCFSERSMKLMNLCYHLPTDTLWSTHSCTDIERAISHDKYEKYNSNLINFLQQDL